MSLAKAYTPNDFEPTIYALWEKSKVFEPRGQGDPYTIVLPPPNANGYLHVGHALGTAIEDILVRYHRMKGRDSVLIPGADHAGFETWVVYERELAKQGKSRFDFTRDQLYSQVWDFVEKQRGNVELQLRALGLGASWKDMVFTLDNKVVDTVYETFKKMLDDDLIYRGERLVNYCTTHQTSFADIEVEHKTEQGTLWKIAYPTFERVGEVVIATTRPETMFGDTAIAVHPEDDRYKHLIGGHVVLPLNDREIPIIADEYVDRNYGTGIVKITPGHDPNDFEMGERHGLEIRQVIDFDGTMINVPQQFDGLTTLEARKKTLAALQSLDLIRGQEDIEHAVGHCYKCDTVIEPLVKEQWFIRVKPLAEKAITAIERGDITFTPANKAAEVTRYLGGLKDWNISRQIAWGIPIPMFQNTDDFKDWIYSDRVDEKSIVVNNTTYRREEDTFDTWFSSGQWPYITTDCLSGGELAKHYPLDVMETASDILYQWVSRMIMLGLYRTGQVPFRHVYLHGLVLDQHGHKMSKSKGNVVNPMEAIAEYGSDALRLGLISSRSAAQPQAFSPGKVVAARNFCNKLWNIARYIEATLGDAYTPSAPEPTSIADHWVVSRLMNATSALDDHIAGYRFAEAGDVLYHTIWDDVADWYIEASKVEPNPHMLAWVLDTCLRMAHPFVPFVTETTWQALPWTDDILAGREWPNALEHSDIASAQFGRLKRLVAEARYVTSSLPGNERYTILYLDDSLVADNTELIRHLSRAKSVEKVDQARGLRLAASGRDAWLDIDAETLYEHQSNLETRLAETRDYIDKLKARLSNDRYVSSAPAHLVEESRDELATKMTLVERLEAELEVLGS